MDYPQLLQNSWSSSRQGAWAGRGFRFQDAVASLLTLRVWSGAEAGNVVIPEGFDDVTLCDDQSSTFVQIKSRGGGLFSITEVTAWLKESWKRCQAIHGSLPCNRVILALERGITGYPTTGWLRPVSAVPELESVLKDHFDAFQLEHSRIVQLPNPVDMALTLVADALNVPEGAAWLHVLELRRQIGSLSDANASASYDCRASLGLTQVQRILDECTATIDRGALEEAIRQDICETIAFESPHPDPAFYQGVDVFPGHVVAGLTIDRPKLLDQIESGLTARRSALIVGPSGSGKSAALWMTAFRTRHAIRWYRVKKLEPRHVEPLIRFAKACRPRLEAPIAFAVDPLGDTNTSGWDALVVELQHHQGVLATGSIREEDLFLIHNAHLSHIAHPRLDAVLAEQLWQSLVHAGATAWSGWREPFANSNGLLLEFVHILTSGRRLTETLSRQVDRRLRERRDAELRILRLVALAHAFGGTLSAKKLKDTVALTDGDLQRALRRLVAEHLVVEHHDGVLSGLHELRSTELARLTHRSPPPGIADTIQQVILNVDVRVLRTVVSRALASELASDDDILAASELRLQVESSLSTLCETLQALGMEESRRLALRWVSVLVETNLPKFQWEDALFFSNLESELPSVFSQRFRNAVKDIRRAAPVASLRQGLVTKVTDERWLDLLRNDTSMETLSRTLLCLSGIALGRGVEESIVEHIRCAPNLPLAEVAEVLSAARAVDVALARNAAEALGGPPTLLGRVLEETPWCHGLRVVDEDALEVHGEYRFVAPSHQKDAHGDIVRLIELIFSVVPDVEIVEIRAIDYSGASARDVNANLDIKRMSRANAPERPIISWNRMRHDVAKRVIAASTATERQTRVLSLLRKTVVVLTSVGEALVNGRALREEEATRLVELRGELTELPPPHASPSVPALGTPDGSVPLDKEGIVFGAIVNNVVPRLLGERRGMRSVVVLIRRTIIPEVNAMRRASAWSYLDAAPIAEVDGLEEALKFLSAVAFHLADGGKQAEVYARAKAKRRRARSNPLRAVATSVVQLAERRLSASIQMTLREIRELGVRPEVVRREPRDDSGLVLPADELGFMIGVSSVNEWFVALPRIKEICQQNIEAARGVFVAPVAKGRLLNPWACMIRFDVTSASDAFASWPTKLPCEVFEGEAYGYFDRAVSALSESSAIVSCAGLVLRPREGDVVEEGIEKYLKAREALGKLPNAAGTGSIDEVTSLLDRMARSVLDQWDAVRVGAEPVAEVAQSIQGCLKGESGPFTTEILGARILLTERDVASVDSPGID